MLETGGEEESNDREKGRYGGARRGRDGRK